jgi:hypothetical protein
VLLTLLASPLREESTAGDQQTHTRAVALALADSDTQPLFTSVDKCLRKDTERPLQIAEWFLRATRSTATLKAHIEAAEIEVSVLSMCATESVCLMYDDQSFWDGVFSACSATLATAVSRWRFTNNVTPVYDTYTYRAAHAQLLQLCTYSQLCACACGCILEREELFHHLFQVRLISFYSLSSQTYACGQPLRQMFADSVQENTLALRRLSKVVLAALAGHTEEHGAGTNRAEAQNVRASVRRACS